MKDLADIALIDLMKANHDRAAFNELYVRYWHVVYDISLRKIHDADAAKDLVHDVFVELWNRKETLQIHTTFGGYLYSMLNNRLIDLHRKRKTQERFETENQQSDASSSYNGYEQVYFAELQERIDIEVSKMPPAMQQIFVLSRYEQLSLKEIAERLSVSTQTVKNQIHNALQRLRAKELNV